MAKCISCGSSIPGGQQICSMCYGDPDYGRDGYYQKWLEDLDQRQQQEQQEGE